LFIYRVQPALLPKVRMLLELTRVDKVFQIFVTVDEALASFIENPAETTRIISN
jgi:anti-anti-sigma regulatory factor